MTTPTVNKLEPIIGKIQCTLSRAVHPYQKRQIGREIVPTNVGGSTISGLKDGLVNLGITPCLIHSKNRGTVIKAVRGLEYNQDY